MYVCMYVYIYIYIGPRGAAAEPGDAGQLRPGRGGAREFRDVVFEDVWFETNSLYRPSTKLKVWGLHT